jgi:hypothetical protein
MTQIILTGSTASGARAQAFIAEESAVLSRVVVVSLLVLVDATSLIATSWPSDMRQRRRSAEPCLLERRDEWSHPRCAHKQKARRSSAEPLGSFENRAGKVENPICLRG